MYIYIYILCTYYILYSVYILCMLSHLKIKFSLKFSEFDNNTAKAKKKKLYRKNIEKQGIPTNFYTRHLM